MVADSHSCTVTTPSVCLTQDLGIGVLSPLIGRALASSTLGKRPLGNGVSHASRRRRRIAAAASAMATQMASTASPVQGAEGAGFEGYRDKTAAGSAG
jgi:hypothetical protein